MKPEAFDRLFYEHAPPLLAFLTYRLGDRATAEDVLADTFERALRKRGLFDRRRGDLKAWLYSIALNLVRDRARRAAIEQRALSRSAAGEQKVSEELGARVVLRHTLADALQTLSEEEREALSLRYGGDLTVPEIAKMLDLPVSTIEGRVSRGLRKLRAVLEE
jgi:RNA polymerase sigma factor (sigma-70 family)